MLAIAVSQHFELHGSKRLAAALTLLEAFVVVDHQLACGPVCHVPQAHDKALRASEHEGPAQTDVHALAVLHFTQTGVTRRQHHQSGSPQIQRRHLGRLEIPLLRRFAADWPPPGSDRTAGAGLQTTAAWCHRG